jgi:hypothetical protein
LVNDADGGRRELRAPVHYECYKTVLGLGWFAEKV